MASVRRVRRRLISTLLTAVIFAALGLRAVAQPPTAQDVISNLSMRNAMLSTFQAHVNIRLHTGIPFLNPTFEGMTYFKKPDQHEVVFTKSPSYAKGFDQLYSDVSDPAVWDKKFICTLDGEQDYNGNKDVALRLVQRVRGSLDHESVLVDTRHWVIDQIVYYYYSGGRIQVDKGYNYEDGFAVLSDEHAQIAMPPFPHARADAHYTQYKINVAIDDSVFTEKATKHIGVDAK
jgi:outer membrane lipoprotein-sorting protein